MMEMLYIDRKKGDSITFVLDNDEEIIVTIENCDADFGASIAIEAPSNVKVWRGIYDDQHNSQLITGK